jgi:hypothetical protein
MQKISNLHFISPAIPNFLYILSVKKEDSFPYILSESGTKT